MALDGPAGGGSVSTTDRVVDALRTRMLEGALAPGVALREVSVAAELEVSRNTLREALRLLTSEGLVVQSPNRGASVKNFTVSEVRDIYRTRRVLEVQAATESAVATDETVRGDGVGRGGQGVRRTSSALA